VHPNELVRARMRRSRSRRHAFLVSLHTTVTRCTHESEDRSRCSLARGSRDQHRRVIDLSFRRSSPFWNLRDDADPPCPRERSRVSPLPRGINAEVHCEVPRSRANSSSAKGRSLRSKLSLSQQAELPLRFTGSIPGWGTRRYRSISHPPPSRRRATSTLDSSHWRTVHLGSGATSTPGRIASRLTRCCCGAGGRAGGRAGRGGGGGGGPRSLSHGRRRVRPRGNGTTAMGRSDGCESVCVCVDRQQRQPC